MKKLLLICIALLAQPIAAAVGEPELELKGYISAWSQDCAGGSCQLPKPGERNRPVTLRLAMPAAPGQASAAHSAETLALPGGGELPASIDLFAICPYAGKDSCAGRYFQAQVSLSGGAGAFCAASLNVSDFAPFPVLMCAGIAPDGRRFGVTLHRQPL